MLCVLTIINMHFYEHCTDMSLKEDSNCPRFWHCTDNLSSVLASVILATGVKPHKSGRAHMARAGREPITWVWA